MVTVEFNKENPKNAFTPLVQQTCGWPNKGMPQKNKGTNQNKVVSPHIFLTRGKG
jgi:hypothetical protein